MTPCAQAAAIATSIKTRNQLAVKSHVRRQKPDASAEIRDDSLSSRIGRCATLVLGQERISSRSQDQWTDSVHNGRGSSGLAARLRLDVVHTATSYA